MTDRFANLIGAAVIAGFHLVLLAATISAGWRWWSVLAVNLVLFMLWFSLLVDAWDR
jgi:hypothetical protein